MRSGREEYIVLPEDAGKRLDVFLSERAEISRSTAARLCEDGSVSVGKTPEKKNFKLSEGDTVEACFPEPEPSEALPEDIPLDVVYEDGDIIVINKPQGMVVHPAAGNADGTLVNALLHHCGDSLSAIGGVVRPGIVHRIDKDTGGLLVVAKNDMAHTALADAIKRHDVRRIYRALIVGNIREDAGTVDAPIGRHPVDRKRMAVIRDPRLASREAVTHWSVIERFDGFTLVECRLETGRTHQIRVHMAHIGHPVLGDPVYGGDKTAFFKQNKALIHGQCLHAVELCLDHPRSGKRMTFSAPLTEDTERLIKKLRGITTK